MHLKNDYKYYKYLVHYLVLSFRCNSFSFLCCFIFFFSSFAFSLSRKLFTNLKTKNPAR